MPEAIDQQPLSLSKRPRPVISCLECRRKKLKCDRTQPCQQCVKSGRPERCSYQAGQEPDGSASGPVGHIAKRPRVDSDEMVEGHVEPSPGPTRLNAVVPAVKAGIIEDLQERVAKLEYSLQALKHPDVNGITTGVEPGSRNPRVEMRSHRENRLKCRPVTYFPEANEFIHKVQNDNNDTEMVSIRIDLGHLQVTTSLDERSGGHRPPSSNDLKTRQLLPPKRICELLVALYFDNLEHCFRILHRPSFEAQLENFWTSTDESAAYSSGFAPQLVGVLSIAATLGTHPECVTAAGSADGFLFGATDFMQQYLDTLCGKLKYQLPALQVQMLILMLRWMRLERIDDLWSLSGQILRQALVMELDQDPSQFSDISAFESELRRRIWMSIVEEDLMLSILCAKPCLVPSYTCQSPLNVNDDELHDGLVQLPASRPVEEWTDTLCQYILAQSLPHRIAACKYMDSSTGIQYENVLSHTRHMEQVLQKLPAPLRFDHMGDDAAKAPARLMARMELDISIRRPLLHLYSPFAYATGEDDIYRDARLSLIQSCLMLTSYQDLFDPKFSELDVPQPQGYWDFFYNVYRHELNQAVLGLCFEGKRLNTVTIPDGTASSDHQTAIDSCNTPFKHPIYTKATIVHSIKDTLEPMRRRIAHPGAKLKDLVYLTIILASIHADQDANSKEEMMKEALNGLISAVQAQLQVEDTPRSSAENGDKTHATSSSAPTADAPFKGADFDASWQGFPDFDYSSLRRPDPKPQT